MFNQKDKEIKRLKEQLRLKEREIRRVEADYRERARQGVAQVDNLTATNRELREKLRRGPAVKDVAIVTAGLAKDSDTLVGSDGVSFWEIGPLGQRRVSRTFLVKG